MQASLLAELLKTSTVFSSVSRGYLKKLLKAKHNGRLDGIKFFLQKLYCAERELSW
jgi:hypothetical protein